MIFQTPNGKFSIQTCPAVKLNEKFNSFRKKATRFKEYMRNSVPLCEGEITRLILTEDACYCVVEKKKSQWV